MIVGIRPGPVSELTVGPNAIDIKAHAAELAIDFNRVIQFF